MALLNPSDTIAPGLGGISAVLALAVSSLVVFLMPYWVLRGPTRGPFIRRFGMSAVGLIGLAWLFALEFHRDFFVFPTQIVLILVSIALTRLDDFVRTDRRLPVYPWVSVGVFVVFALWIGWLMIMSYAIVTRTEPRWIESTAYNLLNGVIGLGLLSTGITIRDRVKRTVVYRDGAIFLDDRNVSALLSPQEARIVDAFFSVPQYTHTCRSLAAHLVSRSTEGAESLVSPELQLDCERCLAERWTASQCHAYRNLKNRISDTKKYLELLQIGTIVPISENPREIKEAGWCLRLFDDVRVSTARQVVAPDGRRGRHGQNTPEPGSSI